jgi:hypothetical protein
VGRSHADSGECLLSSECNAYRKSDVHFTGRRGPLCGPVMARLSSTLLQNEGKDVKDQLREKPRGAWHLAGLAGLATETLVMMNKKYFHTIEDMYSVGKSAT